MVDYPPTDRRDTLPEDLDQLSKLIDRLALERQSKSTALLSLLRLLEERHRDICETLFSEALPENRQHLYALLKDIEVNGGWPYIQRMKLQALLANLPDLDFESLFPSSVAVLDEDRFPGEGK
jgi:hypothetical protein